MGSGECRFDIRRLAVGAGCENVAGGRFDDRQFRARAGGPGFAVNQMKIWQFEEPLSEDAEVLAKFSVNPPNVYGFGHQAYYQHVVNCIRYEQPQLVDGLEGRRSLELISAIYESIETGREVRMRFVPRFCRLGVRDLGKYAP